MCTETRAQAAAEISDTGASKGTDNTHADTHRHTRRYWDGELSNPPPQSRAPPGALRHRGPLSHVLPAGFKSDPPSHLQRGQGPASLALRPRPARAAACPEGPGLPLAARRVNLRLPAPRPPAPLLPGEPCLRGTLGAEDTAASGAVRCSRTQRPACGGKWMPDLMGAAVAAGRPESAALRRPFPSPGAEAHSAQIFSQGPVLPGMAYRPL